MIKDLCFEIIQKCPNNCIFCSSESSIEKCNMIDFKTFKRTVQFFYNNGGIEEISLSGGEPMLHPDIYRMVKFCSDFGIKTTLYTSGIINRTKFYTSSDIHIQRMLDQLGENEEISREKFANLEACGLSKVVFDLQACEVDQYNQLMGTKNSMCYVLQSLLYSSFYNFESSIHFVPNKVNYNQLQDVLELAELAGVDELRILKFVPQGRGRENCNQLQLSNEELEKFVKQAKSLKSATVKIKVGIPLTNENKHICTAGYDKVVIRYDGEILPCPAFKDIDLKLLEEKGFKVVNIYDNLHEFEFKNESHEIPLCEQMGRHG